MRILLFLIISIIIGCKNETSFTKNGPYFPGEIRSELNISAESEMLISNNVIKSTEVTTVTLNSLDQNLNPIFNGGGLVSFQSSGNGSVQFLNIKDLNNGSYSIDVRGVKAGNVIIFPILNREKIKGKEVSLTINPGDLDLTKTKVDFSRKILGLNQSMQVEVFPSDQNGNLIFDNNLSLNPTIIDGTSSGNFSGFVYNLATGTYTATMIATTVGTDSKVNVSFRRLGSSISQRKFLVQNSTLDLSFSEISSPKTSIIIGEQITLTLLLKTSSNQEYAGSNLPLNEDVPIKIYIDSSSTATAQLVSLTKIANNRYTIRLQAQSSGNLNVRAEVNGTVINPTLGINVL